LRTIGGIDDPPWASALNGRTRLTTKPLAGSPSASNGPRRLTSESPTNSTTIFLIVKPRRGTVTPLPDTESVLVSFHCSSILWWSPYLCFIKRTPRIIKQLSLRQKIEKAYGILEVLQLVLVITVLVSAFVNLQRHEIH
jgi:hypothetical protein